MNKSQWAWQALKKSVSSLLALCLFLMAGQAYALNATFDYEAATGTLTGFAGAGSTTVTQANTAAGETLQAVGSPNPMGSAVTGGAVVIGGGGDSLMADNGYFNETSVTFSLVSGKSFDLTSMAFAENTGTAQTVTLTSSKGAATVTLTAGGQATFSSISTGFANMQGITSFTVTSSAAGGFVLSFDNIALSNIAPPTVTAISPTSGPAAGGTAVTITGTNFIAGATVSIGGAVATGVSVVNSTTITATTPAGTAGAQNVVVTTSSGSATGTGLFTYIAPPIVTAISPTSGPTAGGTSMTITGTNFTGATSVTIGGAAATGVTVVNSTTITATTPAGTAGAQNVVVTTPGGSGTGTGLYTYYATPTVTGISPIGGPTAGGTSITITGTNFTGATSVTVGGAAATGVTVVNATTITATTPAGTAGAQNVVVTTPGGSGTGTGLFTYTTVPGAPTGVTATAGNTQVSVAFSAPASNGGSAITTYTATSSPGGFTGTCAGPAACAITVTGLTNGTSYTFTVTATNSAGTSAASASSNSVTPAAAPTYSVTYNGNTNTGGTAPSDAGAYAQGATVTVLGNTGTLTKTGYTFAGWNTAANGSGTSYAAGATFTMGTANVTLYAQWTPSATVPGAPTGVTATAGNAQASVAFSAPASNGGSAITTYTATSNPGGFTGTCAGPAACAITVTGLTNGTSYTFTVTATNSAGTGAVSVASNSVTPAAALTVTAISPTSGPTAGGTSVTITGTNFIAGATVSIGGAAATGVSVVNSTTITATTPAGTAGAQNVAVTTSGVTGTGTGLFTYAAAAPTVTGISPNSGPTMGGTSVTITGSNFTGATSVTIGGTAAASVVVVNATTITAVTPAGTAGAQNVAVTTPGGTAAGTSLFTYATTRPDPTKDATVQAMIGAQIMSAQRFTSAQIDNIFGHLQDLHQGFDLKSDQFKLQLNAPGKERFLMAASALMDNRQIVPDVQSALNHSATDKVAKLANQLIDNYDSNIPGNYSARHEADTAPTLNQRLFGNAVLGLWASGKLDYGSMSNQANTTDHFSSSGVTFGLDRKVDNNLIVGAAIGLGSDNTDVDSFGSKTKSSLSAGTVYASYHPLKKLFVDALMGYGNLSYDNNRWVSTGNTMVTGNRTGQSWFGSLSASDNLDMGKFTLAPYLRGDFMSANLNPYTEQGLATYALSYDGTNVNSRSAAAGAVGYYDYPLPSGMLTSSLKGQYMHSYNQDATQGMYYSDIGPSGGYYLLTSSAIPQEMESLGFGLSYKRRDGLTAGLTYTASVGSNSYISQMIRANIRIGF